MSVNFKDTVKTNRRTKMTNFITFLANAIGNSLQP